MPVPATGSFAVYPLSIYQVDANGWSYTANCGVSFPAARDNQAAVDFFNSGVDNPLVPASGPIALAWSALATVPLAPSGTSVLEMFPDTSQIVFNPGGSQQIVDILSGDFPAGFSATNIRIKLKVYIRDLDAGNGSFGDLNLRYFGSSIKTFDLSGAQPGSLNEYQSGATDIVGAGVYFNAAQTFKSFGFQQQLNLTGATTSLAYFWPVLVEMTGDYITDSSQIVTATPTSNLNAGDLVTVTDPQLRMQDVRNIYLETVVDGETVRTLVPITYISRDGRTIIVRLPRALSGNGTDELIAVFFTGEVSLAILSPQLADGSGIYKLTPDKTDDTYYDRTDPLAPTEVDMKIPCPFIRTGFF